MKKEEIDKILESLRPAIEAVADPAVKAIIATLLTIINAQQKIIEDLTERLKGVTGLRSTHLIDFSKNFILQKAQNPLKMVVISRLS